MNKLVDYMNDHQRDPRLNEILFPSYSEKRCMEMITLYEPSEENIKLSKANFKLKLFYYIFTCGAPDATWHRMVISPPPTRTSQPECFVTIFL